MPGTGEYLADVAEGITRVEDLPKAKVIIRSRNYKGATIKGADALVAAEELIDCGAPNVSYTTWMI